MASNKGGPFDIWIELRCDRSRARPGRICHSSQNANHVPEAQIDCAGLGPLSIQHNIVNAKDPFQAPIVGYDRQAANMMLSHASQSLVDVAIRAADENSSAHHLADGNVCRTQIARS